MKTIHRPASMVMPYLREKIAGGDVVHGSPRQDLNELKPMTSDCLYIDDTTGERITREPLIWATDIAEMAIFYGAVYKIVRQAGLHRGVGIKPVRNPSKVVIGYTYFLSDMAKELIYSYEKDGMRSAAYHMPKKLLSYDPQGNEWSTPSIIHHPPSIAISSECLSFDIYHLSPPNSDPDIRGHYEKFSIPAEST